MSSVGKANVFYFKKGKKTMKELTLSEVNSVSGGIGPLLTALVAGWTLATLSSAANTIDGAVNEVKERMMNSQFE